MPSDLTICHFVLADELWNDVHDYFEKEKGQLIKLLEGFDIVIDHVGGTSIPGILTKGDVDIQMTIRVNDFPKVVEIMKNYAQIKKPEMWTQQKAVFKRSDKRFPTDYFVTIAGTKLDIMYRNARDLLKNDPVLLAKYNILKKSFEGKTYGEWRPIKTAFWKAIQPSEK